MTPLVRTMLARLPRPWRRRRPAAAPPVADLAVLGSNRPTGPVNPGGLPKLGRVHCAAPAPVGGKHRAPEQPAAAPFAGDDFPTVPIRAITAETVAFPRQLLTAFVPVPAGAR